MLVTQLALFGQVAIMCGKLGGWLMFSVCRAGFWAIVLSLTVVVPAAAQDDGIDFTMAYQSQQVNCVGCSVMKFPRGLDVDLAGKVTEMWSLVAQFDWSRKSFSTTENEHFTSFGGGVRWNTPVFVVTPFAQVVMGVTRDTVNLLGTH